MTIKPLKNDAYDRLPELHQACEKILEAKAEEWSWRSFRESFERIIVEICGASQAGPQEFHTERFQISTEIPVEYSTSRDDAVEIHSVLGEELFSELIAWEPVINSEKARWLQLNEPELWAKIEVMIAEKIDDARITVEAKK